MPSLSTCMGRMSVPGVSFLYSLFSCNWRLSNLYSFSSSFSQILRMKDYERERRLDERQKRIQRKQRQESLISWLGSDSSCRWIPDQNLDTFTSWNRDSSYVQMKKYSRKTVSCLMNLFCGPRIPILLISFFRRWSRSPFQSLLLLLEPEFD